MGCIKKVGSPIEELPGLFFVKFLNLTRAHMSPRKAASLVFTQYYGARFWAIKDFTTSIGTEKPRPWASG